MYSYALFNLRSSAYSADAGRFLYEQTCEMAAWVDRNGFDAVVLPEHHGMQDGFISAPLTLAGLIAGKSERIKIYISALILPLYDPARLAEQLSVLDICSGGRVSIVAGIGYRREEYDMFGVDWDRRGKIMDEKLDIVVKALQGMPVTWNGCEIRVQPSCRSSPRTLVSVGGSSRAAARRAARFDLPFWPPLMDRELFDFYAECCREAGFRRRLMNAGEPPTLFISEDPDRSWSKIGAHLLYEAKTYAQWQPKGQHSYLKSSAATIDSLRAEGKFRIYTPDECIDFIRNESDGVVVHAPMTGGLPVEEGWRSLELYVQKVLPVVKENSARSRAV